MRTKVIHIIGTMDIGGAENYLFNLLSALDLRIYDIEVYYLVGKGGIAHKLSTLGIPCQSLITKGQRDFLQIPHLVSLFRKKRPDIVHTHVHAANYWIAIACKLAKVSVLIESIHDQHIHSAKKLYLIRILEKINSRLVDQIIAVSEGVRAHIINELGVDPKKTMTLHNGIRTKYVAKAKPLTRKTFGITNDSFLVGCVANLIPTKKGYEYLLPAFAELKDEIPHAKLLIIGDGPLRELMIKLTRELNIENDVQLLGHRDDVFQILPLFDVFVLASLFEGLPMVLLEAMFFRKPIVATGVGGIPELVRDKTTGLLVPPANKEALGKAILELYHNKSLMKEVSQNAHALVVEHFTIEKIAGQVHDLYTKLLNKKRPSQ